MHAVEPGQETTGELVMAAARALRRRFSAALEQYDVTPSQSRALRTIVAEPGVRLSVVAERLRIAPRSATEVVDALESRGLVVRQTDAADRRATCVVATDEGSRLQARIDITRLHESEQFLAELPAHDRAELDRILRALAGDLHEQAHA